MSTQTLTIEGSSPLHRIVPRGVLRSLEGMGIVLLALELFTFASRNLTHQGDLKTYLYAAHAMATGADPYDPRALEAIAGRRVMPYVYPPITLPFLQALHDAPSRTVAAVWMWGRLLLLGSLVMLWWRRVLPDRSPLVITLVAVFGWNSAALWDLGAGNVALIEAALVWCALVAWTQGRRGVFTTLILVASCFKVAPAMFLLLWAVPTPTTSGRPRAAVLAMAGSALLVLGPMLAGPAASMRPFWSALPLASATGAANPSALALLGELLPMLGMPARELPLVSTLLWALYVAGLLRFSLPALRQAWLARDAMRCAMVAVFLFVLVSPRPMAYGYVLLTPAALGLLPAGLRRSPGPLLVGGLLAAQGLAQRTGNMMSSPLLTHAPFLMALGLWLLWVESERAAAQRAGGLEAANAR